MDTLSLRKYRRKRSLDDGYPTALIQLSKSKSLPRGNAALSDKGIVKREREFLEFYINSTPLSELLDQFYGSKGSILDNWIGVLGSSVNKKADIIKVKQLLGKSASDKEIREAYPSEWSDREFQRYFEKYQEELSKPEVIIYCCAECGDYDCGGIWVKIDKTNNSFTWTITEKDKQLAFEFDKYQYFDLFDKYIRQLEKKD